MGKAAGLSSVLKEQRIALITIINSFPQIQGLGTALKILFSGKFDVKIGDGDRDPKFRLRRSEIVSLFNAFGR